MNIKWNQVAIAAAMGFLMGAVFSNLYMGRRIPDRPPLGSDGLLEMVSRELGLTGSQGEKIYIILNKYKPEMDRMFESNKSQIESIRRRLKAETAVILTPEQLGKLEKFEEKIRAHKKRGGMPGIHSPRPGSGGHFTLAHQDYLFLANGPGGLFSSSNAKTFR